METTRVTVKMNAEETSKFIISKGVKQGDALSATLFNL